MSMSFGFTEEERVVDHNPLRRAITQATFERKDKILFFASAGNEGANTRKVMFPARHELVIPIYGTDATGGFLEALNPRIKRDGPSIFGTLAQEVPCSTPHEEGEVFVTGKSFATAIAAGIAGMLLQYVQILEQKKMRNDAVAIALDWMDQLSTQRGMLALFQNMAEQPPDRRYYLDPVRFFQQPEEVREANIITAVDSSK